MNAIRTLFLIMALFCVQAQADVIVDFQERFELTKNANGETLIIDKKLLENVSVLNFLSYLKEVFETKELATSTNPTCVATDYDKKSEVVYNLVKKTIELMSKFQFDLIVKSEGFEKFLSKFEGEFNNYISKESVRAMANLDNPTYFVKNNRKGYIVEKLKKLIKDSIQIPGGVKLALFFGETYQDYVLQKRVYEQNILLSYLLTFSADQLGLTEIQQQQAISSIFESRINVGKYFSAKKESKKAQENWLGYGAEKIADMRDNAQKRWDKNKKTFDMEIRRFEPIFSLAQYKSNPIYVNLGFKKGTFSAKPALTFDEACADYIYLKRFGYGLVRIGMDVLGVPFSSTIDKLIIEQYQNHIPLEGLLYGVFEIEKSKLIEDLRRQAMNPFMR